MTEDDFEELRRRFGTDIDAWPAPHRREAAALLAGRTSTTPLDPDDDLDRLVLEAIAAPTDDRALARQVLARVRQARRPVFAFAMPRPLALPAAAAGLALVLMAASGAGYTLAGSGGDRLDEALLAFAIGAPAADLAETGDLFGL
jgi:hypothetical protein